MKKLLFLLGLALSAFGGDVLPAAQADASKPASDKTAMLTRFANEAFDKGYKALRDAAATFPREAGDPRRLSRCEYPEELLSWCACKAASAELRRELIVRNAVVLRETVAKNPAIDIKDFMPAFLDFGSGNLKQLFLQCYCLAGLGFKKLRIVAVDPIYADPLLVAYFQRVWHFLFADKERTPGFEFILELHSSVASVPRIRFSFVTVIDVEGLAFLLPEEKTEDAVSGYQMTLLDTRPGHVQAHSDLLALCPQIDFRGLVVGLGSCEILHLKGLYE